MLEVTFGVEFECVFAFHESLLRHHLSSAGDNSTIIKEIPDDTRRDFRRCANDYLLSRPMYMGWGLTSAVPLLASGERSGADLIEERRAKFGYRPYADEILHVAKPIFPQGTDTQSLIYQGKRSDFTQWHISEDTSIMGASKADLLARLGDRIKNPIEWDSHSLELVSRILSPTPDAFSEITTYLDSLHGTASSRHGAFVTNHCGMHVHIGLPSPTDAAPGSDLPTFDLPTLQHLAYILIMYEDEISNLHHPSRREGSAASQTDIASNREIIYDEMAAAAMPPLDDDNDDWIAEFLANPDAEMPPPCDGDNNDHEDGAEQVDESIRLDFVRIRIFDPDMTITKLSRLMCGGSKNHIVNFTYLARAATLPRTIEFRQHEACLDSEAVRWWVLFLTGLVQMAHRMANQYEMPINDGGWNGEGYPHTDTAGGAKIGELFEMMGFDEEGREYYRRKVAGYAAI